MTVQDNVFRGPAPVSGGPGVSVVHPAIKLGEPGSSAHIVGNTITDVRDRHPRRAGSSQATVEGNDLTDNDIGIRWNSAETGCAIEANAVSGGRTGIADRERGSVRRRQHGQGRQLARYLCRLTGRPTLEGNTLCGSETNLLIEGTAAPVIGKNEICPDGVDPAE